jgi:hypothetical protein
MFLCACGAVMPLQGAAVFLAGNLLQCVSHFQLAALSRGSKSGSEETAYKIPTGATVVMCHTVAMTHITCCCDMYCKCSLRVVNVRQASEGRHIGTANSRCMLWIGTHT